MRRVQYNDGNCYKYVCITTNQTHTEYKLILTITLTL